MKNPILLLFILLCSICSFGQADSVANSSIAQPLSISYFNAKSLDRNIQLTWTVAGNEDAKSFAVERSDATSNWYKVGGKLGTGRVGEARYEFVDAIPKPNTGYKYRLMIINKDGRAFYSITQAALLEEAMFFELKKNPVQASLEIETHLTSPTVVRTVIIAQYGQEISTETVKVVAGQKLITVNTANLPAGLYRVVVEAGRQTKVFSFVKE